MGAFGEEAALNHWAEDCFDGVGTDPLAVLRGILDNRTPLLAFQFIGRVMRRSQWKAAGFDVTQDRGGNYSAFESGGVWFRLRGLGRLTDRQLVAARTGGRDLHTVNDVEWFLRLGGNERELIDIPEHVCTVVRAHNTPDLAQRVAHLKEAVRLAPGNVQYREEWYTLRIAGGEIAAIDEAAQFFRNDIDVVVHSGAAEAWLKLMLDSQGATAAESLAEALREGLRRIERAEPEGRLYAGWALGFVEGKKVELEKMWQRVCVPRR